MVFPDNSGKECPASNLIKLLLKECFDARNIEVFFIMHAKEAQLSQGFIKSW